LYGKDDKNGLFQRSVSLTPAYSKVRTWVFS